VHAVYLWAYCCEHNRLYTHSRYEPVQKYALLSTPDNIYDRNIYSLCQMMPNNAVVSVDRGYALVKLKAEVSVKKDFILTAGN